MSLKLSSTQHRVFNALLSLALAAFVLSALCDTVLGALGAFKLAPHNALQVLGVKFVLALLSAALLVVALTYAAVCEACTTRRSAAHT